MTITYDYWLLLLLFSWWNAKSCVFHHWWKSHELTHLPEGKRSYLSPKVAATKAHLGVWKLGEPGKMTGFIAGDPAESQPQCSHWKWTPPDMGPDGNQLGAQLQSG